jgi:vitamin B12 transporter
MAKHFISIAIIFVSIGCQAQIILKGKVYDDNNLPLIGANVFLKGSYNGTTTDTSGNFTLPIQDIDSAYLTISFLGYQTQFLKLTEKNCNSLLTIHLSENFDKLDEVIITAGSFEASEKNRAVVLDPIEIATTASSEGNILGALATFPGVQKNGETGKILVRGGDSHESKTYMDGLLVSSPYTSSVPDLPARGRFSPFMFNGIMFSTGGYSAEYGQALSSVLELNTPGQFDESVTSVGLMNLGASIGHTEVNTRMAYSGEINYTNLYPYFKMAKHHLNWIKTPESFGGNFYCRLKTGKKGTIKADMTCTHSSSNLDYSNFNSTYNKIGLANTNVFVKTNYNTEINKKLILKIGFAHNTNSDTKNLDTDKFKENLMSDHLKMGAIYYASKILSAKAGIEMLALDYKSEFNQSTEKLNFTNHVQDIISATYAESDIKISKGIALRAGVRGEYSSFSQKPNIAPRVSTAIKISKVGQVSLAYGKYYQQPQPDYLKYTHSLDFEQADHFILNYQLEKNKRFLRTEVYYKKYNKLVTYTENNYGRFENLHNLGSGYAKGIDFFWKDSKTFRYTDYWISYSWLDTKRKFENYPLSVSPDFASSHHASVVVKRWIRQINSQLSLTYSFSSGRPYNNPNLQTFMSERTPAIHDVSANFSYITNLWGNFTIVHLSVTNILGFENIYTYRYSAIGDNKGSYQETPVKSMVDRSIMLGIFISIK